MCVSADSLSCLASVHLLERNIQTADVTSKFFFSEGNLLTYATYQKMLSRSIQLDAQETSTVTSSYLYNTVVISTGKLLTHTGNCG